MKKKFIIGITALVVLGSVGVLLYPKFFPSEPERKVLYWTDPMMPDYKSSTPGKSPMGMEMVPVYENDTAGAMAMNKDVHEGHADEIDYYTCTMHPSVKETKPGKCPICSMDLVPVMKKAKTSNDQVDLTFSVSPIKQQLIGVKFSPVEVRTLEKVIHAVGRVGYNERRLAVVNLRIGGWIQDLFVDFTGKFVSKGQQLFTLYSPELVSAQREYLIALESSQNEEQVEDASPLLETARQRLRLWGISDEQIAELEERGEPETYLAIESPIAGYVIEKMALKGMRVEPGMELYKIANLSTVWVYADVYEYELPHVKVGQQAAVKLSYFPGELFKGRISYIFPYLNPNTRTARVRIEFPNPGGKLKPEMFADVEIRVNLGKKLAVPESAILNTGERQIVFVDKGDGLFEVRFVKFGDRAEGFFEIKEGLKAGERVVSYANFLIDAESKVQGVLQRIEGGGTPTLEHKH